MMLVDVKPGQLVRVKGGAYSPVMHVAEVGDGYDVVRVFWFSQAQRLEHGEFRSAALELVSANDGYAYLIRCCLCAGHLFSDHGTIRCDTCNCSHRVSAGEP